MPLTSKGTCTHMHISQSPPQPLNTVKKGGVVLELAPLACKKSLVMSSKSMEIMFVAGNCHVESVYTTDISKQYKLGLTYPCCARLISIYLSVLWHWVLLISWFRVHYGLLEEWWWQSPLWASSLWCSEGDPSKCWGSDFGLECLF